MNRQILCSIAGMIMLANSGCTNQADTVRFNLSQLKTLK